MRNVNATDCHQYNCVDIIYSKLRKVHCMCVCVCVCVCGGGGGGGGESTNVISPVQNRIANTSYNFVIQLKERVEGNIFL